MENHVTYEKIRIAIYGLCILEDPVGEQIDGKRNDKGIAPLNTKEYSYVHIFIFGNGPHNNKVQIPVVITGAMLNRVTINSLFLEPDQYDLLAPHC